MLHFEIKLPNSAIFDNIYLQQPRFTSWEPGQPNRYHDCVCLDVNFGGNWNDIKCSKLHPYICEKHSKAGMRYILYYKKSKKP